MVGGGSGEVVRRALRLLCAAATLIGAVGLTVGGARLLFRSTPAFADGAVPCAANTTPTDPGAGFCANYNGDVTWYGTYGSPSAPLPSTDGFGLCAEPPASGGHFPQPSYDYVLGAPPAGAGGDQNALGFALSEGAALGWWHGVPGQFTSAQAAVAAKLLYDQVAWGSAIPALDPGVGAALAELRAWFAEARGTSAAPPTISLGLTNGASSFAGSTTVLAHIQFAGSNGPVVGQELSFGVTNGTFNSASGPTSVVVATDGNGNASVALFASGGAPVVVTVATPAAAPIGHPGLDFYHPTTGDLLAQTVAGFVAPVPLNANATFATASPPTPQSGTVSVQKSGDDQAYYGVGGATFQVLQGSSVVATLTTDASGTTPTSAPLPIGSYTVHESVAPTGYSVQPDQPVTVTANQDTVAAFTGSRQERVIPSTVTINKRDAQSGAPLAGADFAVAYSSAANGVFDQQLGTCTTDTAGACQPAGNDGPTDLLPGAYQVRELQAPSGYALDPSTSVQKVVLLPGESGSVTFSDYQLGSLKVQKSGDDASYASVTGAVFTVSGPNPATGIVGFLTVGPDGTSNTIAGMEPGSYTVTESTPPPGYQAMAPVTVAVASGAATTTLDVLDHVTPAVLTIFKVDRQTLAPLAGASFTVAFDAFHSGDYSVGAGSCTTGSNGACSPAGNDGNNAMYPGNYRITEVVAPPGYTLNPATATQDITLTPGEVDVVHFSDSMVVSASFQKVASGNVNPSLVTLAGMDVTVRQGTATGPIVGSCTSGASGSCATPAVLDTGSSYCWSEIAAPAGLSGGAHGCFVATDTQAAHPITVDDAGEFVAVAALKVDTTSPDVGLPGATFDLYRKDGGDGPGIVPSAPADAASEPGETWVARSVTGSDGTASFPLQYPGFAYCVVEVVAPVGYSANPGQHCTAVLSGSTSTPPAPTSVTVSDTPAMVSLAAHKFNALLPNTGIPGATYDLYAEGSAPPATAKVTVPVDAKKIPGDSWFSRGTTDAHGDLAFHVPAGYAWCLMEHAAPSDYVPDPALHCSGIVTTSSAPSSTTVALPETRSTVYVAARKFNSRQPDTVIAGATYELLVVGPMPAGYDGGPASGAPSGAAVPAGDTYWGQGTSNAQGLLTFAVPAGYSWCLHELSAPAGYDTDPAYHCTSVLTNDSPSTAASIALPEVPGPGGLAYTGGPSPWLPISGALLVLGGVGLLVIRRRFPERRDAE